MRRAPAGRRRRHGGAAAGAAGAVAGGGRPRRPRRLPPPCPVILRFFCQAEGGIRDHCVTGVQTCALPICSLVPAVRRDVRDVNRAVYAELTYHAAYDPQRAIRTRRHKYVRRWGERDVPVLPNIDDSPSKDLLLHHGLAEMPRAREELYDLLFDPNEAHNLADSP